MDDELEDEDGVKVRIQNAYNKALQLERKREWEENQRLNDFRNSE